MNKSAWYSSSSMGNRPSASAINGRRRRRRPEQKKTIDSFSEETSSILTSLKQMGRRLSSSFRSLCNSENEIPAPPPKTSCGTPTAAAAVSFYDNFKQQQQPTTRKSRQFKDSNFAENPSQKPSTASIGGCFASVRRLHSHDLRRSKDHKRKDNSAEPRNSFFRSTRSLNASTGRRSTVYPVRSHELAFMPDFPLKATVNEASFEVVDVIARGAFGNVIKVRNKTTHEIFALKIMSKNQVIRDKAIQQVKDEANIARGVAEHPFIVSTFHHWQSKRYLYLLSQYIPHGELLHFWARFRPIPEKVVKIYVAEIGIVLDYLHTSNIIYRDLKMENILLDERGHIQLTDFGLSKPLAQGSRTTTICGTLQYIAPEVLTVSPYDHAVDWWSLGILMYALLMGSYPYKATNDHVSMANRVLSSFIDIDGTGSSPQAKLVLHHLLDRNPLTRLRNLRELEREPFLADGIDRLADRAISVFRWI